MPPVPHRKGSGQPGQGVPIGEEGMASGADRSWPHPTSVPSNKGYRRTVRYIRNKHPLYWEGICRNCL